MEEEEQKHWVQLRAECNLNKTFNDLIRTIKEDVEEFNRLPPFKRNYFKLNCTQEKSCFVVQCTNEQESPTGPEMRVEYGLESIIAKEKGVFKSGLFTLHPEWNTESLACDQMVKLNGEKEERPRSIQMLSQLVIVHLLNLMNV